MTLSDDIAKAEQRARAAVVQTVQEHWDWPPAGAPEIKACKVTAAALNRYAAVCRLAGRWEQHEADFVGDAEDAVMLEIERDLARLMEGCP